MWPLIVAPIGKSPNAATAAQLSSDLVGEIVTSGNWICDSGIHSFLAMEDQLIGHRVEEAAAVKRDDQESAE